MRVKRVISNDKVIILKTRAKCELVDVNCYCKMTSIVALDGVTSFVRLKDVTYSCKRMRHSTTIGGMSSGSIPQNIHEVWPRPFWGEAYRWKKIPVDHFIGHIPLFYKKLIKDQIYLIKSRVF